MTRCDVSDWFRFYGATTIGQRGQVVVPVEARREFGLVVGSKLLVVAGPHRQALTFVKAEALEQIIGLIGDRLSQPVKKARAPQVKRSLLRR